MPIFRLSPKESEIIPTKVGPPAQPISPPSASKASAALPKGGTAMFALLALGGDMGCAGGPTLAKLRMPY